jgi:hypothetical protein
MNELSVIADAILTVGFGEKSALPFLFGGQFGP